MGLWRPLCEQKIKRARELRLDLLCVQFVSFIGSARNAIVHTLQKRPTADRAQQLCKCARVRRCRHGLNLAIVAAGRAGLGGL